MAPYDWLFLVVPVTLGVLFCTGWAWVVVHGPDFQAKQRERKLFDEMRENELSRIFKDSGVPQRPAEDEAARRRRVAIEMLGYDPAHPDERHPPR